MGLFRKKQKEQKNNTTDVILTLYSCRKDGSVVRAFAEDLFANVCKGTKQLTEKDFCLILQDDTEVKMHVMDEQTEVAEQAKGMVRYFAQAPLENETVKMAVLQQISLFSCIVGISFSLNDDQERTQFLMETVYELAEDLTAFVLYPNMYLYDADGKLLISIDGKTDFTVFSPKASSTILERDVKPTEADILRIQKNKARLQEQNIPYMEHLQAAVYETECHVWDKENIIHRLAAIFACCVVAEVHSYDMAEAEQKSKDMLEELEKRYQISHFLSEEEKAYIKHPLQEQHARFGWRYECCAVLCWALSLLDLKEPTEICDASEIGGILWNNDLESLMDLAKCRSTEEILELQDLVFRYDWACVDARIHQKELPQLNGEIVYEWHYALNWLVQADGITDWDMVQPHT